MQLQVVEYVQIVFKSQKPLSLNEVHQISLKGWISESRIVLNIPLVVYFVVILCASDGFHSCYLEADSDWSLNLLPCNNAMKIHALKATEHCLPFC